MTGCCLTFMFLFLAKFNGELGLVPRQSGDHPFNAQDVSFEPKHNLLEDISNATLGVWLLPPFITESGYSGWWGVTV